MRLLLLFVLSASTAYSFEIGKCISYTFLTSMGRGAGSQEVSCDKNKGACQMEVTPLGEKDFELSCNNSPPEGDSCVKSGESIKCYCYEDNCFTQEHRSAALEEFKKTGTIVSKNSGRRGNTAAQGNLGSDAPGFSTSHGLFVAVFGFVFAF